MFVFQLKYIYNELRAEYIEYKDKNIICIQLIRLSLTYA